MANWKQGLAPAPGKARIDQLMSNAINANKFGSAEVLVSQDRDYLEKLRDTLRNNLSPTPISAQARASINASIAMARSNPIYAGKIGERTAVLDELERLTR